MRVGPASQAAITTRMPKVIAETATVTSSEVPMLQTASTAGLTASLPARASTTVLPATLAGGGLRTPATMKPKPTERSASRAARPGEVDREPVEQQGQEGEDDRQLPDQLG